MNKLIPILVVFGVLVLFGCTSAPVCGDEVCSVGEAISSSPYYCESDCGVDDETCGNGVIDDNENCSTCPSDVTCKNGEKCNAGICERLICGDGVCDSEFGENEVNCPSDCEMCGNGVIDDNENCFTCPSDVTCENGENCNAGICEKLICGDRVCDIGEECMIDCNFPSSLDANFYTEKENYIIREQINIQ